MIHDTNERQNGDLADVRQALMQLYTSSYPQGAPHLYEHLLPKLPDYISALVRRKLDLIVQYETHRDHDSVPDGENLYRHLSNRERTALSMFLNTQVERAHRDVGRDSTLSNNDHDIPHYEVARPIVAYDLIAVASGRKSPEVLERMGCVFFDVDGTKTIVDCTSHSHAGRYLEGLAHFLCKPPKAVRDWLDERDLVAEPYAYAGDEFVVILRSGSAPVDKSVLDAFATFVQQQMATDPVLTSFVSFDDPGFVMEYAEWTDEQRDAYHRDPAAMQQEFSKARELLPARFIPSVSCGSSTFADALRLAESPDTEEATTLEEFGINAYHLMIAQADENLKRDKQTFRANITDPKWKEFLLRNGENRRLEREKDALSVRIRELMHDVGERDMRIRHLEARELHLQAMVVRLERELQEMQRTFNERIRALTEENVRLKGKAGA